MRAKALSILVANAEKALKEFAPDKEKRANEQAERIENFVKGLSSDVGNMLARFWFQKERKQMTDHQVKILEEFVNFTKTLTKDVRSLLRRFEKGQTFEEKIDKEIKEIETYVRKKLREFDEAMSGTSDTSKKRLSKYVDNIVSGVTKPFKGKSFGVAELKKAGKSVADRLTKVI